MLITWLAASSFASSAGPGADAPFELAVPVHPGSLLGPVQVADVPLQPSIDAAAAEFGVPAVDPLRDGVGGEPLRPDVTRQWAGYGPLDLRDGQDPTLSGAAILLGVSADRLDRRLARQRPRRRRAPRRRGGAARTAASAPTPTCSRPGGPRSRRSPAATTPSSSGSTPSTCSPAVWQGVHEVAATGEPSTSTASRRSARACSPPSGAAACRRCPTTRAPRSGSPPAPTTTRTTAAAAPTSTYVVIHDDRGQLLGHALAGSRTARRRCPRTTSCGRATARSPRWWREDDIAWHAGNWSYNAAASASSTRASSTIPRTWYTDAMYEARRALVARHPRAHAVPRTGTHIIGHVEVPGARHTDPGPGWDWDYYMSLVEGTWAVTGDLTGVVAVEDVFTGDRIDGASSPSSRPATRWTVGRTMAGLRHGLRSPRWAPGVIADWVSSC